MSLSDRTQLREKALSEYTNQSRKLREKVVISDSRLPHREWNRNDKSTTPSNPTVSDLKRGSNYDGHKSAGKNSTLSFKTLRVSPKDEIDDIKPGDDEFFNEESDSGDDYRQDDNTDNMDTDDEEQDNENPFARLNSMGEVRFEKAKRDRSIIEFSFSCYDLFEFGGLSSRPCAYISIYAIIGDYTPEDGPTIPESAKVLLGKTEVVRYNCDPVFGSRAQLPAKRDEELNLVIEARVHDIGKDMFSSFGSMGSVYFTLSDVFNKMDSLLDRPLIPSPYLAKRKAQAGNIRIFADVINKATNKTFNLDMVVDGCSSSVKYNFVIERVSRGEIAIPVFKSDHIKKKPSSFKKYDFLDYNFHGVAMRKISYSAACGGDPSRLFRITLFSKDSKFMLEPIGYIETCLVNLMKMAPKTVLWFRQVDGEGAYRSVELLSNNMDLKRINTRRKLGTVCFRIDLNNKKTGFETVGQQQQPRVHKTSTSIMKSQILFRPNKEEAKGFNRSKSEAGPSRGEGNSLKKLMYWAVASKEEKQAREERKLAERFR